MLFKNLADLMVGNTAITILVTGNEAAMTVTVIPKPSKTGEGTEARAIPLILTGTAAELDEGFCGKLEKFTGARRSLDEQYEATEAVLEAAKKASAEKAAKGVAKTAKAVAAKPAGANPGKGNSDPDDDDELGGDGSTGEPATATVAPTQPSANLFA